MTFFHQGHFPQFFYQFVQKRPEEMKFQNQNSTLSSNFIMLEI
jgi:hypothetical protein